MAWTSCTMTRACSLAFGSTGSKNAAGISSAVIVRRVGHASGLIVSMLDALSVWDRAHEKSPWRGGQKEEEGATPRKKWPTLNTLVFFRVLCDISASLSSRQGSHFRMIY